MWFVVSAHARMDGGVIQNCIDCTRMSSTIMPYAAVVRTIENCMRYAVRYRGVGSRRQPVSQRARETQTVAAAMETPDQLR